MAKCCGCGYVEVGVTMVWLCRVGVVIRDDAGVWLTFKTVREITSSTKNMHDEMWLF